MRCRRPCRATRRGPGARASSTRSASPRASVDPSPRSAETARRVSSMPSTTSPRERRTTSSARSGSSASASSASAVSSWIASPASVWASTSWTSRDEPHPLREHGAARLLLARALRLGQQQLRLVGAPPVLALDEPGGNADHDAPPCRRAAAATARRHRRHRERRQRGARRPRTARRGGEPVDGRRDADHGERRPRCRARRGRRPSAATRRRSPVTASEAGTAPSAAAGRSTPATRRTRQQQREVGDGARGRRRRGADQRRDDEQREQHEPQRAHVARAGLAIGQHRDQRGATGTPAAPASGEQPATRVKRRPRGAGLSSTRGWRPGGDAARRRSAPVRPAAPMWRAGAACLRVVGMTALARSRSVGLTQALRRRRSGARHRPRRALAARCSRSSARTARARRRRSRSWRGSGAADGGHVRVLGADPSRRAPRVARPDRRRAAGVGAGSRPHRARGRRALRRLSRRTRAASPRRSRWWGSTTARASMATRALGRPASPARRRTGPCRAAPSCCSSTSPPPGSTRPRGAPPGR